MLDSAKRYFICSLPYQISVKEGLLQREQIEDEMSEQDFDEIKFSMNIFCASKTYLTLYQGVCSFYDCANGGYLSDLYNHMTIPC